MDIADLVLENAEVALVIENYFTSDGHGHRYDGYLTFGAEAGRRSVVVMLCEFENRALLTDGWQDATVVTYAGLVSKLWEHVQGDRDYRRRYPEQCVFIEHLNRRFAGGTVLTNKDTLLGFVDVMCRAGLAGEYGAVKQESAAVRVADRLREEAIQQYTESRELLQRVKQNLRTYGAAHLRGQVNEVLGEDRITDVRASWQGRWQCGRLPSGAALDPR